MTRLYLMIGHTELDSDALRAALGRHGPWQDRSVSLVRQSPTPTLRREMLVCAGAAEVVSLVRDDAAQARYIMIEGSDAPACAAIESCVRASFEITGVPELLAAAASSYERDPPALVRLALVSGARSNSAILELFERARSSSLPEIRHAAIEALGLTQWPVALPLIWDSAVNDPDPDLRDFSALVASSLVVAGPEADHAL
jgi:hypothetical protein